LPARLDANPDVLVFAGVSVIAATRDSVNGYWFSISQPSRRQSREARSSQQNPGAKRMASPRTDGLSVFLQDCAVTI
jgi:hypothetical protein